MQTVDTTSPSRAGSRDAVQQAPADPVGESPPADPWRRVCGKTCLLVLLCTPITVPSLAQKVFDPNQCHQLVVPKSGSPLWMTSAIFSNNLEDLSLLWVDAARQEVQEVALKAETSKAEVVPKAMTWMSALSKQTREQSRRDIQGPASIWAAGTGYQLEFKIPAQLFRLSEKLEKSGSVQLAARNDKSGASILAVFNLYPMSSGYLAFGDILEPGPAKPPNSAFFYFEPSAGLDIFEKIPLTKAVRNQYTRNYLPFLTAINDADTGEIGYILFLEEQPYLAEVKPGHSGFRRLPDFPKSFQTRPRLETESELRGLRIWEQETKWFRTLEQADMAAGLYSRNNSLFLLGKKMENRVPSWWLVKLDPATGGEVFKKRLPTNAAHLTVVPGERFWALLEKDWVRSITAGAPFTRVNSLILIPTAWLEEEEDGRLASARRVRCAAGNAPLK